MCSSDLSIGEFYFSWAGHHRAGLTLQPPCGKQQYQGDSAGSVLHPANVELIGIDPRLSDVKRGGKISSGFKAAVPRDNLAGNPIPWGEFY